MNNYGFRNLIVWQKSMELVRQVYINTKNFPKEEIFSLTSQMRRAAVSIPSNIAEGTSRKTDKDYKYFMTISRGSSLELETQVEIARNLNYYTKEACDVQLELLHEIQRMLNKLSI